MTRERSELVTAAAEAVRERLEGREVTVAVVLGSGLSGLARRLTEPVRIGYGVIPGFPAPTVVGHEGELVAGRLGGRGVVVQSGRFHMYEGHSADLAALPIRTFAKLGIKTLIVTNAAGGINPTFRAGTIMLITDHLNLTGRNPLQGLVLPGEERFPDMSEAYDRGLADLARKVAAAKGIDLAAGVYAGLLGPSYETPAEVKMLAKLGADAVGMSTVVEVITARANGLACLGFSTITNAAAGVTGELLSHHDVMTVAGAAGDRVGDIIAGVIASAARF